MSYEVLARKLRPSGFEALVGQDHVVRALRHALETGRMHHAYLFTGTRGVGKTTIARILAKALNCEQGVSATPCGTCSVCLEVKENRFVDLIEVDAASRTGVDDTRELLENAQYLPTRGRYKVYLIDEVHMLSIQSFNALLKTLEEPPEHVKFLLATTDPKKVPVTVLSRCLQFQLKNLSREAISAYLGDVLKDEGVEFDDAALETIARFAGGSMRDALSLTDQAIAFGQGCLRGDDVVDMLGVVGEDAITELLDALARGDTEALLSTSATLAANNADFADVLARMLERLHRLAVDAALGKASVDFAEDELQLFYQIALIGQRDIDLAPEPRSGFEMTLLRMLAFAPDTPSPVPRKNAPVGSDTETAAPPSERAEPSNAERPAPDTSASTEATSAEPPPAASETVKATAPPADLPLDKEAETAGKPLAASHAHAGEWHEITASLNLAGVARMIAEHSVPDEMNNDRVHLVLDQRHETLLNDRQVEVLAAALSESLGRQVQLTVEPGELQGESPAQRAERIAAEMQAAAEQAINSDNAVSSFINEFGGTVEEIKPR